MNKTPVNVAIIGLTRMSVSIGMALREYNQNPKNPLNFTATGFDEDARQEKAALEVGGLDKTGAMAQIVRDAHIVLVEQAPGSLEFAYSIFGPELKSGAVVLDMSHLQVQSARLAARYFPKNDAGKSVAYLVGVKSGVHNDYLYDLRADIASASPRLFASSDMMIAAEPSCPPEAVKLASDLASILGMTPRFMSPDEYDALTNFTENLPVLVGAGLFATLHQSGARADLQRAINRPFAMATLGLRDMQAKDMEALLIHSAQTSVYHLDALIGVLQEMRAIRASGNEESIKALANEIILAFGLWEDHRATGKWEDMGGPPERSNLLRSLFGFGALEDAAKKLEKQGKPKA